MSTPEGVALSQHDDVPVRRVGFLILRAFFAQFWVLQAYSKAHDEASSTTSLANLTHWSTALTADFLKTTPLPEFMVAPYTHLAPFVELALGLLIAVGYKTRWVLLGAAAFLVSLDLGLLLKADHDSVKSNTIILLALLWAADWAKWDVFCLSKVASPPRVAE